jgi:hypothetical protein
MPIPTTWLYAATDCPALPASTGLLVPGTSDPTAATKLDPLVSGPGSLTTPFNRNAVGLDNVGRYGSGAWALCEGFGFSQGPTALQLAVDAGIVALDSPVAIAAKVKALTNNASNYVWALLTGDLQLYTSAATVPVGACAYLGRVDTLGGAIVRFDLSGVPYLAGGRVRRRTGDQGMPLDTPPARYSILTETAGGHYEWDGTQYLRLWEPLALQAETINAADLVSLPAGYQALMFGKLTVRGNLRVRGHLKIMGW